MKRKSLAIILLILTVLMTFVSCGSKKLEQTYGVKQDTKFGAVYLDVSIDDFVAAGFNYGDSCNVTFSNGLTLEDIPFFSGYYVRRGMPLIVGYPGYDYIAVTRNNLGLWDEAGLTDSDTAVVTLNEAGKYLNEQDTLSQSYSNERADYSSDIQFANFRAISVSNIKENFLYRGASPVDNQKNRASTVNALLENNKINFVLDLADSEEEFLGYQAEADFASDYVANLYKDGKVALLSMSAGYSDDVYKQKLADGLKQMIGAQGPIYIHCLEGKDRTGLVCFLLEALVGSSYEEMKNDYMTTYENYYGITKDSAPDKYNAIVSLYFDVYASFLHGTEDINVLASADYSKDAENYLLEAGMTADEITALRDMITKN